jgi:hypothetical protein
MAGVFALSVSIAFDKVSLGPAAAVLALRVTVASYAHLRLVGFPGRMRRPLVVILESIEALMRRGP